MAESPDLLHLSGQRHCTNPWLSPSGNIPKWTGTDSLWSYWPFFQPLEADTSPDLQIGDPALDLASSGFGLHSPTLDSMCLELGRASGGPGGPGQEP